MINHKRGGKMKKRLTQSEEFEIMKLVLDKFLWLGVGIMAYGLYVLVSGVTAEAGIFSKGIITMIIGIVLLILFMIIIVKEYEIIR